MGTIKCNECGDSVKNLSDLQPVYVKYRNETTLMCKYCHEMYRQYIHITRGIGKKTKPKKGLMFHVKQFYKKL